MVSPKLPHPLGVDVGVFLRLDANEKMADSGISYEPFRDAPTAALCFPFAQQQVTVETVGSTWMYVSW